MKKKASAPDHTDVFERKQINFFSFYNATNVKLKIKIGGGVMRQGYIFYTFRIKFKHNTLTCLNSYFYLNSIRFFYYYYYYYQ